MPGATRPPIRSWSPAGLAQPRCMRRRRIDERRAQSSLTAIEILACAPIGCRTRCHPCRRIPSPARGGRGRNRRGFCFRKSDPTDRRPAGDRSGSAVGFFLRHPALPDKTIEQNREMTRNALSQNGREARSRSAWRCPSAATGRAADAARPPVGLGADTTALSSGTRRKGLPQSAIRAIVQSREGYLWLGAGSRSGAVRRRQVLRFSTGRSGDLRDNEIWALEERPRRRGFGSARVAVSRSTRCTFRTFTKADGCPTIGSVPSISIGTAMCGLRVRTEWPGGGGRFTSHQQDGLTKQLRFAFVRSRRRRVAGGGQPGPSLCRRAVRGDRRAGRRNGRSREPPHGRFWRRVWLTFENGVVKRVRNDSITVYRPLDGVPDCGFPRCLTMRRATGGLTSRDGLFRLAEGESGRLVRGHQQTVGTIYWLCQDLKAAFGWGSKPTGLARLRLSKFSVPSDRKPGFCRPTHADTFFRTVAAISGSAPTSGSRAGKPGPASPVTGRREGLPVTSVSSVGEDRDGIYGRASGGDLYQMRGDRAVRCPVWRHFYDIKTTTATGRTACGSALPARLVLARKNDRWTGIRVKDGLPERPRCVHGARPQRRLVGGDARWRRGPLSRRQVHDLQEHAAWPTKPRGGRLRGRRPARSWFTRARGLSRYATASSRTFTERDGLFAITSAHAPTTAPVRSGSAVTTGCSPRQGGLPRFRCWQDSRRASQGFGLRRRSAEPGFSSPAPNPTRGVRPTAGCLFCSLKGLVAVGVVARLRRQSCHPCTSNPF